jgi:SAM-dependent methyltransferase
MHTSQMNIPLLPPPPGASEWANSLGESYVGAVISVIRNDSPRNILEIGGGSAWIASRLRERYSTASYVLVDPSVRDSAAGVEVVLDYFPSSQLADRSFDLVLGFNVLEHVPDPLSFLRSIRRQLSANGRVILVYPDCERQLLRGDLNVLIHEHLSYFTEESSRWLATAAGFNVLSLHSENDAFTVVLEAGSSHAEGHPQLNEFKLIKTSAEAFQNLLTNISDVIRQHLDNGHYVGFHGATAGLNTFLFLTCLGDHPNVRLYDGDVSKVGSYLPACSSPIMSSIDGSYAENSLLVISAMSFYEQIRKFAVEKAGFDSLRLLPLAAN